jgi:hypothetical protein
MSGAMFKEAIATEPLEVQNRRRASPAFKKSPAVERGVLPPHGPQFHALRATG